MGAIDPGLFQDLGLEMQQEEEAKGKAQATGERQLYCKQSCEARTEPSGVPELGTKGGVRYPATAQKFRCRLQIMTRSGYPASSVGLESPNLLTWI